MRPSDDRHDRDSTVEDRQATVRRVTVPEAAEILGVTPDAVRSRLRRGKLRKDKDKYGTVMVVLEADSSDGHDRQDDQGDRPTTADLVQVLKDQVEHLRQQLDEAHRANAEHRRLLAAALERIPELEPARETPSEPRESPETASDLSPGDPQGGDAGRETSESRPSWWRRWFGG